MFDVSYKKFRKYSSKKDQREWIKDELENMFSMYKRIQIKETGVIYTIDDVDSLSSEIYRYLIEEKNIEKKAGENFIYFIFGFLTVTFMLFLIFYYKYFDRSFMKILFVSITISSFLSSIVTFFCYIVLKFRSENAKSSAYGKLLGGFLVAFAVSMGGLELVKTPSESSDDVYKVSPSTLSSIEDAERYIDGKTFIATPSGGVWHKVTFSSGNFTLWYGIPQSPGWNLSEEGPYEIKSSRYADTGRKFYYVTLGNKAVNYKFIINNLSFVVGDGYNVSTTRDQAEEGDWDPWN